MLALPHQVWAPPSPFVAQGRPSPTKAWRRRTGLKIVQAMADNEEEAPLAPSSSSSSSREAAEAGIEALEAKLGVGRRNRKGGADRKRGPNLRTKAEMRQTKISKDWESMTLSEKAWELYTGETGVLFWLNKAAYASIFILVGGWIVFRFIGPALGWYELSSPLLPPDQVFKSSN